jgi:hypothetical protein
MGGLAGFKRAEFPSELRSTRSDDGLLSGKLAGDHFLHEFVQENPADPPGAYGLNHFDLIVHRFACLHLVEVLTVIIMVAGSPPNDWRCGSYDGFILCGEDLQRLQVRRRRRPPPPRFGESHRVEFGEARRAQVQNARPTRRVCAD